MGAQPTEAAIRKACEEAGVSPVWSKAEDGYVARAAIFALARRIEAESAHQPDARDARIAELEAKLREIARASEYARAHGLVGHAPFRVIETAVAQALGGSTDA